MSSSGLREGAVPSDTMSNSWSQHLRGTHRGPRAGGQEWLPRAPPRALEVEATAVGPLQEQSPLTWPKECQWDPLGLRED